MSDTTTDTTEAAPEKRNKALRDLLARLKQISDPRPCVDCGAEAATIHGRCEFCHMTTSNPEA